MNKSILLSIRPKWVEKILNGKKTIEVRKQFPKDYKGWVYIYCTKGKPYLNHYGYGDGSFQLDVPYNYNPNDIDYMCNGKVVARFRCDNVEEISAKNIESFTKDSCLTVKQIEDYLWKNICNGYAIHISKLEIFDEPKELREFKRYHEPSEHSACWKCKRFGTGCVSCSITKAPQNYCYIEGDE